MEIIVHILKEIGLVTVAMAPYLLFGFLAAGVLSVLISKNYVQKHLGQPGWIGSLKAALIGVPLPICSCGVIPLAASLRKQGASRGSTASFLASTPQTGVDSLMITYALLGGGFAIFRAVAAFLSGILCGTAVSLASKNEIEEKKINAPLDEKKNHQNPIKEMLTYGFVALPRDLAKAVLLGIIISGILSSFIPDSFFADNIGGSPMGMLIMLIIGIPLYVCSSASVPIALAFMKAGISPGAALVFLIMGPATNAATLTTLWKIIGKKQLVWFLITLSLTAVCAGLLMDFIAPSIGIKDHLGHEHKHYGILNLIWAIVLLALLLKGLLPERRKYKT